MARQSVSSRAPRVSWIAIFTGMCFIAISSAHAEGVLVSELLNKPAVVKDDQDDDDRLAGRVEDVLLDREGRIVSLLVTRNPVANRKDPTVASPPAYRSSAYQQLFEYDVANTRYDARRQLVYLHEEEARRYFDARDVSLLPLGQVRATELFELPVNLADADNAGTVEDVLVDINEHQALGIVVESGMLFPERYLLPPQLEAYDRSEQELNFALKESEFAALPEISD